MTSPTPCRTAKSDGNYPCLVDPLNREIAEQVLARLRACSPAWHGEPADNPFVLPDGLALFPKDAICLPPINRCEKCDACKSRPTSPKAELFDLLGIAPAEQSSQYVAPPGYDLVRLPTGHLLCPYGYYVGEVRVGWPELHPFDPVIHLRGDEQGHYGFFASSRLCFGRLGMTRRWVELAQHILHRRFRMDAALIAAQAEAGFDP